MTSRFICFLLAALTLGACKKAFLDKQPSTALIVPSTLTDFQNTLNNTTVMPPSPALGEISADNLYFPYSFWQSIDTKEANAYSWAADIYEGQPLDDNWDLPYQQVYYANLVLEELASVPQTTDNSVQWFSIQGSALFIRAYAFYNIAQLFAPVYDDSTAATDAGIPLRLHSDVTAPSVRASVQDTYSQILADLRQAVPLLSPGFPAAQRNLPSRPAAYALLSRVLLSMRSYTQAGLYADSALQLYDTLIDYNTVSTAAFLPFTRLNNETLYQSNVVTSTQCLAALAYPGCVVDSTLYASYAPTDLRRAILFHLNPTTALPNPNGSYAGSIFPFTGLATDECFLVRAECSAREGNTTLALNDLNTLLRHRYLTGSFTTLGASSPAAALALILAERRKELPFRGLRWTDLRRLNKEGYNITLTRLLNGTTYTLIPNSNLYTLPIPPDVLNDNPGMIQNKR